MLFGIDPTTWLAVFTFPLVIAFAAVIGLASAWFERKDQKRLDAYHLEQQRIQAEAQQAVIDCEELWTQWDWERERGLR